MLRFNVLIEVVPGVVPGWVRRLVPRSLESLCGLGEGVLRLIREVRDALILACQVHVFVEVVAWAWQLTLLLEMQLEHVILWSHRVTASFSLWTVCAERRVDLVGAGAWLPRTLLSNFLDV